MTTTHRPRRAEGRERMGLSRLDPLPPPPLEPDRDEARRLAEQELQRAEYDIAQPTPIDLLAQAIGDAIDALFGVQAPSGLGAVLLVAAVLAIVGLIVIAFVIWGRPRAVARSQAAPALLFGDRDERDAAALRTDAERAATAGAWDEAIALRFRALARSALERGAVDLGPGATVQAFARRAGAVFPAHAADVDAAADIFDDVRYLRRPATPDSYALLARLDEALLRERPATEAVAR
ncbi:DUF4129 domain-containing protein [Microbacterium sp. LRZ72]|uniref:DUF4129 domain-containing protein n=1 Tax=Microbacterium sp. LRZ72 TaxID=2942481 RepID=UPI0029A1AF3F|nr:DUF4129 domain-containing protein [Microbacterium sp. LRZ72]MDX2377051.1 DUF4129 domain-containing protein [Microbacterium sp. LRZ72]